MFYGTSHLFRLGLYVDDQVFAKPNCSDEIPWTPNEDVAVVRFINELVTEEESDKGLSEGEYSSHYELYLRAMKEVGANTVIAEGFVDHVAKWGVYRAFSDCQVPEPSRHFCERTFSWIESGKPHCVAAALALGREQLIPDMFTRILEKSHFSKEKAPIFHYYLNRHIQLDGDSHGPLSMRLLTQLCDNDELKIKEARVAISDALKARILFWDEVSLALDRV